MATVTPNFLWPVPQSTDLVKDGATAIEALGDSIDSSLVDLKGGTTGQVLSKTSGTDMDFTWVTSDDANAIQNSIVNAKGDLIGASANDTPAILSVGANGETLVADNAATTGLRYNANYAAGKNAIINGAFNVWQRGTSFSNPFGYTADRFNLALNGGTPTGTISRQTFTPGTAPVAGYESAYFFRYNYTALNSANIILVQQLIEDVRTFAGQTVTISFWAKADTTRTVSSLMRQYFGSGGSPSAAVDTASQANSLTTSWQRFTQTVAIPSISGKTIGTNPDSSLQLHLYLPISAGSTIDIWGVQVEAGSVATAFQTATGTLQGELAACQRYYYRFAATGTNQYFGAAYARSASFAFAIVKQPVTMRSTPSLAFASGSTYFRFQLGSGDFDVTTLDGTYYATTDTALVRMSSSGMTTGNGGMAQFNNASAFIEMSSEL